MEWERKKAYCWAILAGLNAALSAIAAKLFAAQIKYALVVFFSVLMWGSWVNSTKLLSSLQATVTNFATNFVFSGLAGFFLFGEPLQVKVSQSGKLCKLFTTTHWIWMYKVSRRKVSHSEKLLVYRSCIDRDWCRSA